MSEHFHDIEGDPTSLENLVRQEPEWAVAAIRRMRTRLHFEDEIHVRIRALLRGLACGDNSCIFERPRGMATNGGCRTLKDNTEMRIALQKLAHGLREIIDTPLPPECSVLQHDASSVRKKP